MQHAFWTTICGSETRYSVQSSAQHGRRRVISQGSGDRTPRMGSAAAKGMPGERITTSRPTQVTA